MIERTGSTVAVQQNAFAGRTDLPAGFTLPALVTSIKAGALNDAKLPRGFAIPARTTDLDETAFDEALLGDDDWWDKYPVAAGSKVGAVEDSQEYKDFDAKYPGKLQKRKLAASAFEQKKIYRLVFRSLTW